MITSLHESAAMCRPCPSTPSKTPLNTIAKATAKMALWPRKRMTARYKPMRTKIGVLIETTAK
jgi:hypothetical protein